MTASNTTMDSYSVANGGVIDTMSGGAAGTVTLDTTGTNWNNFYSNAQNGLEIHAGGAVTVKDAYIYSNTSDGLSISGNGAVTVTNPYIYSNDTGTRIENFSGGAGVTISGPDRTAGNASVYSNTTANLVVNTHGKLTLNWLSSYGSEVAISPDLHRGGCCSESHQLFHNQHRRGCDHPCFQRYCYGYRCFY